MKVAPSILSIQNNLKENIQKLYQTDCDFIHLDIMDGEFVPNTTWTITEIEKILNKCPKLLDVHLMVEDVMEFIKMFSILNPIYITFHLEAVKNPMEAIMWLKNQHIGVGISIKPDTPILELIPYLEQIDLVLIMSVEPGAGGQSFLMNAVDKVNELKKYRDTHNLSYQIEVDGGINGETVKMISNSDIVVAGSYITNSENYQKQIDNLRI